MKIQLVLPELHFLYVDYKIIGLEVKGTRIKTSCILYYFAKFVSAYTTLNLDCAYFSQSFCNLSNVGLESLLFTINMMVNIIRRMVI